MTLLYEQLDKIEYCNLLIVSTKAIYNTIGSVYCPALKENVIFNAQGFHHLLYKSSGLARPVTERLCRLSLFPLAIPTIKLATSIVGQRKIQVRVNRKKSKLIKTAATYTLIARVGLKNPINVRVIILRIGNGQFTFRSIMKD